MNSTTTGDVTAIDSATESKLPTDTEKIALVQSGTLLRFASENVPKLDPNLSLAIARAVEAQSNRRWSPETSQTFWQAFNQLTELIKPVTMDCLVAVEKNMERKTRLIFWRKAGLESLAQRSSRRYTGALFLLLIVMVPLQLVIWLYSNLSTELDHASTTITVAAASLATKCAELGKPTADVDGKPHVWTQDEIGTYDSIRQSESDLLTQSLQLSSSRLFLAKLIWQELSSKNAPERVNFDRNALDQKDWTLTCSEVLDATRERTQAAALVTARARLFSSILLQFVLPILLGSIGALAFVLRNASEQIKTSTFSTTSPIRNLVRVVLGALMGVVIGLFSSGLSTQISLPPLAMAFLAGYGVEGVFSIFDGFIDRLRQPSVKSDEHS